MVGYGASASPYPPYERRSESPTKFLAHFFAVGTLDDPLRVFLQFVARVARGATLESSIKAAQVKSSIRPSMAALMSARGWLFHKNPDTTALVSSTTLTKPGHAGRAAQHDWPRFRLAPHPPSSGVCPRRRFYPASRAIPDRPACGTARAADSRWPPSSATPR